MPRNESVARNNNPEENIVTVNIEKWQGNFSKLI
jgi:hypothetical protein